MKQVADWELVWLLEVAGAPVSMAGDAGSASLPVWPHQQYADLAAAARWPQAKARAVALDDWLESWLPRLAETGTAVVVFPNAAGEGRVTPPVQLQADLHLELENY